MRSSAERRGRVSRAIARLVYFVTKKAARIAVIAHIVDTLALCLERVDLFLYANNLSRKRYVTKE